MTHICIEVVWGEEAWRRWSLLSNLTCVSDWHNVCWEHLFMRPIEFSAKVWSPESVCLGTSYFCITVKWLPNTSPYSFFYRCTLFYNLPTKSCLLHPHTWKLFWSLFFPHTSFSTSVPFLQAIHCTQVTMFTALTVARELFCGSF